MSTSGILQGTMGKHPDLTRASMDDTSETVAERCNVGTRLGTHMKGSAMQENANTHTQTYQQALTDKHKCTDTKTLGKHGTRTPEHSDVSRKPPVAKACTNLTPSHSYPTCNSAYNYPAPYRTLKRTLNPSSFFQKVTNATGPTALRVHSLALRAY